MSIPLILTCIVILTSSLYLYYTYSVKQAQQALAPLYDMSADPDAFLSKNLNLISFNVKLPHNFLPPTTWILSPQLQRKLFALPENICSFKHIKRQMNHHIFGLPESIMHDPEMDHILSAVEHTFHSELAPLHLRQGIDAFTEHMYGQIQHLKTASSVRNGTLYDVHATMYDLVSLAAIEAFFGPSFPAKEAVPLLLGVDQNLTSAFVPSMLLKPFSWLARQKLGTAAQDSFTGLTRLVEGWLERDGAAKAGNLVKMTESYLSQGKWSRANAARVFGMLLVALVANSSNAISWTLLVAAQNEELNSRLLAEARKDALDTKAQPVFDLASLNEHAPLLMSTIQEVFRHFSFIQVIRYVHQDTVLTHPAMQERVALRKGWRVAAPMRAMHMHPAVWGDEAAVFQPERFLDAAGKAKLRDLGTFGGGSSICSGRHFAVPEVAGTVIMLLQAFALDGPSLQIVQDGNPVYEPKVLQIQQADGSTRSMKWTGRKDDGKVVQSGIMRADGKMYLRFFPRKDTL